MSCGGQPPHPQNRAKIGLDVFKIFSFQLIYVGASPHTPKIIIFREKVGASPHTPKIGIGILGIFQSRSPKS